MCLRRISPGNKKNIDKMLQQCISSCWIAGVAGFAEHIQDSIADESHSERWHDYSTYYNT